MIFRKRHEKKQPYDTNKVRVRNSYYTFSKDYPANMVYRRKAARKKKTYSRSLRVAAAVLCFVLIAFAAYFVTDLGLKFSYKTDTAESVSQSENESDNPQISLLESDGMKALYFTYEKLGDEKYLKTFAQKVVSHDANSAVIDFKTQSGHLCYSSDNEIAMLSKSALFDNETVRNTVSFLKSKNIHVIARIYCFEDNLTASLNSSFAVKYMSSDVTWLDAGEDEGGKAWLNPYSKDAKSYILDIIKEVKEFGVDGFILESVSFPQSGSQDTAGYPGEKDSSKRNEQLLNFITSVKKALSDDKFVLLWQSATDAVSGNEQIYYGSISKSSADGVCADTAERPVGYSIDKKTNYSSLLSLLSNMKASQNEGAKTVPVISSDDYTARLSRTLVQNGYNSFLVFDEEGKY